MCGIAGYLGPSRDDLTVMGRRLAAALAHRGPDDEGVDLLPLPGESRHALLLVHRRLSIIDTSKAGHQPMSDPETGNRIIYNGEIYNFQELRAAFEKAGLRFRSRSDTEVLLKGYAARGLKVLDEVQGMFAFALWDTVLSQLILAVDPMGIKPLYYWVGPRRELVFASELRAILDSGLVRRRLDPAGLEGFLSYGAVQAPQTIVAQVKTLLPGSYLTVSAEGRLSGPHTYWSVPFFPEDDGSPVLPRLEERVEELLQEVIGQHLISDVPIGVFLSGGIDSSAMAVLAKRDAPRLRTFSVTFTEAEFSEAPYSRAVAERHGFDHTELCLSEGDLLARLPAALDAMDQPTIDGMNVYIISQAIRTAGLTVALSGQGGDEVFAGYSTFRQAPAASLWRRRLCAVPPFAWHTLGRLWGLLRNRRRAIPDKLGQFLSGPGDLCSVYFLLRQLFPPTIRRQLFPSGATAASREGLPVELFEDLKHRCARLDPVNAVSLLELRTYLANMLLRDGDVMSMAHSLEVRVPFLDRRVVELIARLPGRMKIDRALPKPLLLRPLGDRLPPAIYQRPKQGFTFPWPHWLRQQLRPLAEAAVSDEQVFRNLGMDPRAAKALWCGFLYRRPGLSWSRIWAIIVLREWAVRRNVTLA